MPLLRNGIVRIVSIFSTRPEIHQHYLHCPANSLLLPLQDAIVNLWHLSHHAVRGKVLGRAIADRSARQRGIHMYFDLCTKEVHLLLGGLLRSSEAVLQSSLSSFSTPRNSLDRGFHTHP
jgi:hypothetical protein